MYAFLLRKVRSKKREFLTALIKNKLFFNQNKIVKTICPWHYRKHACNYLNRQRKAMGSGNKLLDQLIKTELNTR